MNMIVVGCGRVGAELAYRLFRNGNKVVVIDRDETAFLNLPEDFRGRTVHGEAMSQDVLTRADIEQSDGVAVVTSNDTINTVVGHLARVHFQVPKVIVRNFDSDWRSLQEAFGLQIISSSSWGAQRIEELLYPGITQPIFWAGNGEVKVYEFTIRDEWDSHILSDLIPQDGCALVALTRAGHAVLPGWDDTVHTGDVIMVSSSMRGWQELCNKLDQLTADHAQEEV